MKRQSILLVQTNSGKNDMGNKELKIGEIINYRHLKVKVVESSTCIGCIFCFAEEGVCMDFGKDELGPCARGLRKDDTDVKFIKVGEY